MSTLTEYFEKTAYQPTYQIGDRVSGKWNKIPFVGTVGNDRNKVNGDPNPEVTIHLDLPIVLTDQVHYVIIVKHKDIKPLVRIE